MDISDTKHIIILKCAQIPNVKFWKHFTSEWTANIDQAAIYERYADARCAIDNMPVSKYRIISMNKNIYLNLLKEKIIRPEWNKGDRLTYRPYIRMILQEHGVNLPAGFTNRQALELAKKYQAMGALHLSKLINELIARLTHVEWNKINWGYNPYFVKEKYFDPKERAKEKQLARDKDAEDISSGKMTPLQIQKKNSFFNFPNAVVDFNSASKA